MADAEMPMPAGADRNRTGPPGRVLFGPGAPTTMNWTEVLGARDNSSYMEQQAADVLRSFGLSFETITSTLNRESDFEEWHCQILKVLQGNMLQNMVELESGRPYRNDINALQWYLLSTSIQNWITQSMDQRLVEQILLRHSDTKLADRFMYELRKVFREERAIALDHAFWTFTGLHRSDFSTSREFVIAVQYWHGRIFDLDGGVSAFFAISKVLNELETMPHLKELMMVKRKAFYQRLYGDVGLTFTHSNFCDTCVEWLAEIDPLERSVSSVRGLVTG